MKKFASFVLGLLLVVLVAGYWIYRPIAATHPALVNADLPPIIPLREFYANADARWRYQLSPDGKNMSWLESKWLSPALWVKPLEGDEGKTFNTDTSARRHRC